MSDKIQKLVSLCKRRGFIFQGSEVYGGLGSVWDYGPLGVELKNNIKCAWWKKNVYQRDDVVGMDASILMHPEVWRASGHVEGFTDPLVECKSCKKRFRIDMLKTSKKNDKKLCPDCGNAIDVKVNPPRLFNLMFKTHIGPVEDESSISYLRPETAQGIFVNFANVLVASRKKLPFGIAQTGKAFRNEITTGNFIFRTREFEQMEMEYFVKPKEADKHFEYWVNERYNWYINLGIGKKNLKIRPHSKDELAHYAKACSDIEYQFPFGWSELEGIANRGDFDLRQHSKSSGEQLDYFDDEENKRYLPFIIEPSGGVDRSVLAFLTDAYTEEKVKGQTRVVLSLHKDLAPVKVAVLPLLKNRPEIVKLAKTIAANLRKDFVITYDDTAAIGKLYRRQDEIGTPFCITVDVDSLKDKKVTIRDRDTMKQDRIAVNRIAQYLKEAL